MLRAAVNQNNLETTFMTKRSYLYYIFSLILTVSTFALCEVTFRAYDYFTRPRGDISVDDWVKQVSGDLEEHPLLGYRRKPNEQIDETTQVDKFGLANTREAAASDIADVVGIGDSFVEGARQVFFEKFKAENLKYHSLALFGYSPPNYNVLMSEYGVQLHPKAYVYTTYLGNDPGDIKRYEAWRATGKGWFAHNGGFVFPIERQGLVWGWHLLIARAKSFARGVISRTKPDAYASLRGLAGKGDAETIFDYILQAKDVARNQGVRLQVAIVPRSAAHKPLLDPVAAKLVRLCTAQEIDCLDLDPAFGPVEDRARLFAPDGHWNEAGMAAAWAYLWDRKLRRIFHGND